MFLVVGGASRLGSAVATRLVRSGRQVRCTQRMPRHAAGDWVRLDLTRPAGLASALDGVHTVLASAHGLLGRNAGAIAQVDAAGHSRLIEEAARRGVRRFVYVSALDAALDHPAPLWRAKAATERHLAASGLDYTILRPAAFMDFHAHELIGAHVAAGRTVNLLGDGRLRRNFCAVADVADVAVAAMTTDRWRGATLDIGGPDNLTDREVAELYARILRKPARIRTLPAPALRTLAFLVAPVHAGVANVLRLPLQLEGRAGLCFDAAGMADILGRPPTGLAAFIEGRLAAATGS